MNAPGELWCLVGKVWELLQSHRENQSEGNSPSELFGNFWSDQGV